MIIDDRSDPPLRAHIGRLLATHAHAEIAVGCVRLAALDLAPHETMHARHWRILLGRLEAGSLASPGVAPLDDTRLRSLVRLLESGHAEIRSAGLAAWTPDFSLYRGAVQPPHDSGDSDSLQQPADSTHPGSLQPPTVSPHHAGTAPPHPDACLIGAHWFHEPIITDGPSFTVLVTDSAAVALALARFETLWHRSHDVLEPVLTAIRRRQSFNVA